VNSTKSKKKRTLEAMQKILHATDLIWQWFSLLGCVSVQPVVEEGLFLATVKGTLVTD